MTQIQRWDIYDSEGHVIGSSSGAIDFGASGIAEIIQNVVVILTTAIGSVVNDRAFGMNYSFLDQPIDAAQQLIVAEVLGKVQKFEPRVQVTSVTFSGDAITGKLIPQVYIKLLTT